MVRCLLTVSFLLSLAVTSFAATSATDVPMGQSATSADDLFETQRGYFHPELSLSEIYTDNLFNESSATDEEFITTITPALWLSFPGQLQPADPIVTDTTAAGGLLLSRFGEKDDRPFNAFLRYEAGIKRHKNFSSEDITTHKAQGLIRNTWTSGLLFEVRDVYNKSHDAYDPSISVGQRKFTSNLLGLKTSIPVGERVKLVFAYNNFQLDYDTADRDRADNSYSGSAYYALSQKTKPFVQVRYLDVQYDTNTTRDNTQTEYYLGADYEISDKVQVLAKFGMNTKDPESGNSSEDEFVYEIQGDYQFTPKNNLNLQTWRKVKETDLDGANGILNSAVNATFSQMFGQRMVASALAGWSQDDYQDSPRTDDYLTLSLSLGYSLQKWFEISGGYNFVRRDSNEATADYDSNGVFINLTGKL